MELEKQKCDSIYVEDITETEVVQFPKMLNPGGYVEKKNGRDMLRLADRMEMLREGFKITRSWRHGVFDPGIYKAR